MNLKCHDCGGKLGKERIRVICTYGAKEDFSYCQTCFLNRMRKYVEAFRIE